MARRVLVTHFLAFYFIGLSFTSLKAIAVVVRSKISQIASIVKNFFLQWWYPKQTFHFWKLFKVYEVNFTLATNTFITPILTWFSKILDTIFVLGSRQKTIKLAEMEFSFGNLSRHCNWCNWETITIRLTICKFCLSHFSCSIIYIKTLPTFCCLNNTNFVASSELTGLKSANKQ